MGHAVLSTACRSLIGMAQIRSLERGSRGVRRHSTYVDCEYQVVDDSSGPNLLTLSTFGSDTRKDANTVSQSLQFDESSAALLVAAVLEAFPSLRVRLDHGSRS